MQANKAPASCWGLMLLNVWTEIEADNPAVELEQIEWAVGGTSPYLYDAMLFYALFDVVLCRVCVTFIFYHYIIIWLFLPD